MFLKNTEVKKMKKELFVFLIFLIMITACTNNSQTTDNDQTTNQETGETENSDSNDDNNKLEPSGNSVDISELKKFNPVEYMVSYDMTSTYEGEKTTTTMAMYIKGENVRTDTSYEEIESRFYNVDKKSTSCTNQEGEWMCIEFGIEEDNEDSTVEEVDFEDDYYESDSIVIKKDGTMNVAGTTATCYKIEDIVDIEYSYRICYSKEGVPLYMEMKQDGMESKFVATAYSSKVKDSDFDLPAQPIDYGSMIPEGYNI